MTILNKVSIKLVSNYYHDTTFKRIGEWYQKLVSFWYLMIPDDSRTTHHFEALKNGGLKNVF